MKALKSKSLMSLIYAVLLALPLCAILSRVIYVQLNKNANQSYSDNWIQSTTQLTNSSQNMVGATYNVYYQYYDNSSNQYSNYVKYSDISINWSDYGASDEYNYNGFRFAYDQIQLTIGTDNTNVQSIANVWGNTLKEFSFVYESGSLVYNNNAGTGHSNVYILNYKQDKLDNVFEYSVSKFVDENDFGQLNFFQWFDELLLSNNSHNALYVHFANWYLNYAMLISLMQILFLVLMWFVNFARKLLDRGMNYDW